MYTLPFIFSGCALNVASVDKVPFCSLKSSQHKVSTDFYSPHLPYTMLGFNNADFSKRMSCLIVVRKKELHKGKRVEMVMVRITGPKGLLTLPLHCVFLAILCFCPSSSALLFPDDFTEKQWQIMTCLFC